MPPDAAFVAALPVAEDTDGYTFDDEATLVTEAGRPRLVYAATVRDGAGLVVATFHGPQRTLRLHTFLAALAATAPGVPTPTEPAA